ncbi:MAG: hypothetical protein J6V66_07010, partial [Clostridia bacterium]|nr:hypothetical protein [Clostridia bacterium]
MTKKGVRIISLEASEIYGKILKNGEDIGYSLPKKKDYTLFKLFKNVLDYSLDLVELEKIYEDKCRRKFLFPDKSGYDYTYAVINVKFNYTYLSIGCALNLKQLRQYFYENGFNVDGVHYVRYKRSSGSSREGKCLFIDERLYKHMSKWGECGLKNTADIASWEAYKSLSLSSLKGLINIPLDGILYLNDYESSFSEEVISIEEENGKLIAEKKFANINNNIWDGESLLDERMFTGEYKDRHMLLLRNKFFKSCAFKTRLQKWFKDKGISSVEQLKERGFVTMATDISQIVMVTTPSSMKFLKFLKGGLTESNVRKWSENVDCNFGVVKYDKRTKFFNGKMVQTSYQFINTLGLNEETAEQLLKPSIDYISSIRQDYDLMRYHFTDGIRREIDGDDAEISDGLAERCDVIFRLMNLNYGFKETRLYKHFRDDVVENLKKKLKVGKILLSGTNATLFGNGPEMLMAISGEFDVNVKYNESLVLSRGEIACFRFEHGRKLACARSPHITMGNLYYATNNVRNDIWNYFDLGDNVVCVNA